MRSRRLVSIFNLPKPTSAEREFAKGFDDFSKNERDEHIKMETERGFPVCARRPFLPFILKNWLRSNSFNRLETIESLTPHHSRHRLLSAFKLARWRRFYLVNWLKFHTIYHHLIWYGADELRDSRNSHFAISLSWRIEIFDNEKISIGDRTQYN